jgi:hypothetical protein
MLAPSPRRRTDGCRTVRSAQVGCCGRGAGFRAWAASLAPPRRRPGTQAAPISHRLPGPRRGRPAPDASASASAWSTRPRLLAARGARREVARPRAGCFRSHAVISGCAVQRTASGPPLRSPRRHTDRSTGSGHAAQHLRAHSRSYDRGQPWAARPCKRPPRSGMGSCN